MNSLPPRYPSNAPAPSIVNLSDDMASVKLQKLKFRSSNGDFLQPPHLVIDKIVHKPKESRNTAADNEDDKDSEAYEIASLKVELAKARTEARQHARVALYLRRENRRQQSEMEAIRSNQIMFLEQKVGGEGISLVLTTHQPLQYSNIPVASSLSTTRLLSQRVLMSILSKLSWRTSAF